MGALFLFIFIIGSVLVFNMLMQNEGDGKDSPDSVINIRSRSSKKKIGNSG